jgi:hypothetical protein
MYFPSVLFRNLPIRYDSCFKGSYECICYLILIVVSIDELNIDSIDEFQKGMPGLHLKLEGEEPEYYCGDICKMEVSSYYKNLWQCFFMYNNLTSDPESDDTEVQNYRLCCEVSLQVLNECSKC